MVHDYFSTESVQAETGRASTLLICTLMGGMLALSSFVAEWIYSDPFYSSILAVAAALMLGLPIVLAAFAALLKGKLDMDVLVALAVAAAFAIEWYQETAIIAFFFHMSNLMEKRTALGARATIESLIRLTPKTANLVDQQTGKETEVSVNQLRPGQVVRVRPGDNIPADGVVISGDSSVSQANITGESLPVDKRVDDEVFSGTINLTGAMDIRVSRVGGDTTLGQVQKLILQAEQTKMPIMRIIDRYAHWYIPVVLMLAFIVLYFSRNAENPFFRPIAMLIVACPCALVLATPTAMVAGLASAARLGILIKSVTDLELARNITAVVLDKTGTLTTGELAVSRLKPASGVDSAELVSLAASVEQQSRHPAAKAVTEVARKANVKLAAPASFEEVTGQGVRGTIDGGVEVMVGRRKWLEGQGVGLSSLSGEEFQEPEGVSVLYVARNKQCIGWIGLEDRTRGEAKSALEQLRAYGIRHLAMVTGDRWTVARRVAAEMGCTEVQAEVLPHEKLELVDRLQADGHKVAVVGDGVNDAPALAAGDLGIAMGAAGSDVAIHSASIALMSSDLSRLPFLLKLSRAVTNVVWQNLAFGVVFIVGALLAAALGLIGPVLAVVLHTAASAFVVFNSARIVRYGEELGVHAPSASLRGEPRAALSAA